MRLVLALATALLSIGASHAAQVKAQMPALGHDSERDVSLIDTRPVLPPATPRHDDASVLHGVTVPDPYRWLENPDDPKVQAWIAAQNAYTEKVLAAMPDGKAMAARVRAAGDHLDHALVAAARRRHAVLPAGNAAAAAAAADGAGVARRHAARTGRPQRRGRQHRDHQLLALAQRPLSCLWHRRGRQRADHHPCARRGQRQAAGRCPALGRWRHHAAGAGLGCRRARLHLRALRAAAEGARGEAVRRRAGASRAGSAGRQGRGGVRPGLLDGGRIPVAQLARRPAAGGARQPRRRRSRRGLPA